jgi:isopenicillin-N epimerase
VRRKAAAFLGADVDEIALVRNTTEGMNFMLSGLDLKAGDEILVTFHEHGGGMNPCRLKAKRTGAVIKEVRWPAPAEDPDVILQAFDDAITPRSRVMMVSHVMYQSGSAVPLKALAALARSKGIITCIDGAHPPGMLAWTCTTRLLPHEAGGAAWHHVPHVGQPAAQPRSTRSMPASRTA